MNQLGLVTGFWSAETLGRSPWRATEVYLRLFEELERHLPVPLVIFIDPAEETSVRSITSRSKVNADRIVLPTPVYGLPRWSLRKEAEKRAMMRNGSPIKDTAGFAAMTWSKTALLADVARNRILDSSHLGWIDFGIAHVCSPAPIDWTSISYGLTDKPRVCEMRATSHPEVRDRSAYYAVNRGKIASGLFTVPSDFADALDASFAAELENMLATPYYALEESVFGAMNAEPAFFDRWYSDYTGVLANCAGLRTDLATVFGNLSHCRHEGLNERGVQIVRYILDSAIRQTVVLGPAEVAALLFDGFVCAWYSDRTLALDLARLTVALWHYGANEIRPFLRRYGDQLSRNLSFVGLTIDAPPMNWAEFAVRSDAHVWLRGL